MVDHDGVPVTDATFRGKFTLLYFGFSHCPDICPSELVKVGKVMTELGMAFKIYILQYANILLRTFQRKKVSGTWLSRCTSLWTPPETLSGS